MASNPYRQLPDYCFWNKAVGGVPPFALDPMVDAKFHIAAGDKVVTAGSCFAQHISRRLSERGLTYFVPEQAPASFSAAEAADHNYGVFSARYGNIYTAKQLVQLFDQCCGHFRPEISHWTGRDGGYVDPFRPQIQPGGFASIAELLADRERHLAVVRHMFETLDVFVFTLGLTEGWRCVTDDAALPVAPGVAGGDWDPVEYRFVNSRASEVIEELTEFVDRLGSVNPSARIILTVSPVPLIATYEDRHVLVSTIYSKSVLRVAAEEVSSARPAVQYFPSYEIITSTAISNRYFADDLRSVNELGVNHVMRVFFKHFVEETTPKVTTKVIDFGREIGEVVDVICEEDLILQNF